MENSDFAGQLILLRAAKGMTQKQLADKLHVSLRAVTMWEAGEALPRKAVRIQIAVLFGMQPDFFLKEGEIPSLKKTEEDPMNKLLGELSNVIQNADVSAEVKKNCSDALKKILEEREK